MGWMRYRFEADLDDPRPVKWPPPGPYWVTGESLNAEDEGGYSTVVAYLPPDVKVTDWWPEATNITTQERDAITFTDRFQKPDWWED